MTELTMSKELIVAKNDSSSNNNNVVNKSCKKPPSSKKGSGAMHLIKVALYMFRRKGGLGNKSRKSAALPSATNSTLKMLVGSVRPLYLQGGGASPPPPPPLDAPPLLPPPSPEWTGTVGVAMVSPARSEGSSGGGLSRYASAQSLYDLDNHDDHEEITDIIENDLSDGDAYYDGLVGDDMIDSKAEIFIARFYQQMRLQNSN